MPGEGVGVDGKGDWGQRIGGRSGWDRGWGGKDWGRWRRRETERMEVGRSSARMDA